MKLQYKLIILSLLSVLFIGTAAEQPGVSFKEKSSVKKVLFIGDSMTGWMADRLNAYGEENGFEVATVLWDGSTIKKWGTSPNLPSLIKSQNPDAVFLSLGLNELAERNPASLNGYVDKILTAIDGRDFLWIGPPSWPGQHWGEPLNKWLEDKLGKEHFFRSLDLKLDRQSATNPHPTQNGICAWIDEVMKWVPDNTPMKFDSLREPAAKKMLRSKTFIYKRMKETL